MFRSAVTAYSAALLRLVAASARPSILLPPLAFTSSASSFRPLLPSASLLRFPSDFSRGYARGRQALSSSEDDYEDDEDVDDSDDNDFEGDMDEDDFDDDDDDDDANADSD